MNNGSRNGIYRFADVEVDPGTFLVRRNGSVAALEPKALEVLLFLLNNRGRLVLKGELLDAVWQGANVTENVLSREIASLRRALGDEARASFIIQTVHGRGYRFIATVEEDETHTPVADGARTPLGWGSTTPPVLKPPPSKVAWRRSSVALVVLLTLAILVAGTWFVVKRSSASTYRPKEAAQQEYLAGQYFMNVGTRDALDKAIQHFQKAVTIDARFALAYATLADAYSRYEHYFLPPSQYLPQSRAALQMALARDPNDAYAHSIAGRLAYRFDWDLVKAGEELRRARALDPHISHQWFGWYFMSAGQRERADREFELFAAAQPLLVNPNSAYGQYFYLSRRYDRAVAQLKSTLEKEPRTARAHEFLGMTYEQLGNKDLAEIEFKRAMEFSNVIGIASLVHLYGSTGDRERASLMFAKLRAVSATTYVPPYQRAIALLGMGKHEEAIACLEEGYTDRSLLLYNLEFDPRLDPVRKSQEMVNLLSRIRR
jgi:DNA-binding winged helix-turn-helix (wHTH) protein/tetratricopeptide (TPR) repeat protein